MAYSMATGWAFFHAGLAAVRRLRPSAVTQKRRSRLSFAVEEVGDIYAVLDHPYFAVSDKDGKFDLKTLPPGTYTIEAWHEKLGTATQQVTIGPKETKEITFTFKAPAGPTPTN